MLQEETSIKPIKMKKFFQNRYVKFITVVIVVLVTFWLMSQTFMLLNIPSTVIDLGSIVLLLVEGILSFLLIKKIIKT